MIQSINENNHQKVFWQRRSGINTENKHRLGYFQKYYEERKKKDSMISYRFKSITKYIEGKNVRDGTD